MITGVTVALSAMTIVGRNYFGSLERRLMRHRWKMRRHPHVGQHAHSLHPRADQSSP